MPRSVRCNITWVRLVLLLGLTLAVVLVFFITRNRSYHMLLSPDSYHYLDIARNVSSLEGFSTYHLHLGSKTIPDRLTPWPPLFPLLLSIPMSFGVGQIESALAVMIFLYLATVLLITFTVKKLTNICFGLYAGVLFVVISNSVTIWDYVWSEQFFTFLMLVFWSFLLVQSKVTRSRSFVIGLFASLCVLTRYAGIVLVPFGLFYIMYELRKGKSTRRQCFFNSLSYIFGLVPIFVWYVRNIVFSGSLSGVPSPMRINPDLQATLSETIEVMQDVTGMLHWLIIIAVVLWGIRKVSKKRTSSILGIWKYGLLMCFIVMYMAFVVFSVTYRQIDPIHNRYFEVLMPLSIVLLLKIIHSFIQNRKELKIAFWVVAVVLVISISNGTQLIREELPSPKAEIIYAPEAIEWLRDNTKTNDLLIGAEKWNYRIFTGLTVLESGYPYMESLTAVEVKDFLERFPDRFTEEYLITDDFDEDNERYISSFTDIGFVVSLVFENNSHRIYSLNIVE